MMSMNSDWVDNLLKLLHDDTYVESCPIPTISYDDSKVYLEGEAWDILEWVEERRTELYPESIEDYFDDWEDPKQAYAYQNKYPVDDFMFFNLTLVLSRKTDGTIKNYDYKMTATKRKSEGESLCSIMARIEPVFHGCVQKWWKEYNAWPGLTFDDDD